MLQVGTAVGLLAVLLQLQMGVLLHSARCPAPPPPPSRPFCRPCAHSARRASTRTAVLCADELDPAALEATEAALLAALLAVRERRALAAPPDASAAALAAPAPAPALRHDLPFAFPSGMAQPSADEVDLWALLFLIRKGAAAGPVRWASWQADVLQDEEVFESDRAGWRPSTELRATGALDELVDE